MAGVITVVDQIYERQGIKTVLTVDGRVEEVLPGGLPEPGSEVLAREGEPNLKIHLSRDINREQDVPDDVRGALYAISSRLQHVTRGGQENPDEEREDPDDGDTWKTIEWVGAGFQDGAIVLSIDTDGTGFTPGMVDTLVRVVREELQRIEADATISVATPAVS